MLRKQGCVPSALTQNVKDLLASREIENILDNTDFMILLSQAQSDRAILAKQIGISEHQLSYITQSNSGEGLLFYGSVTIPFVDRFPRGEIYDVLTIGKYITNRPPEHEVPESYLDDETFAAILKEAEKYLGFPYVWGGSSPSTSFDCSGFVSYVYNQCGWSFGRLGAQGLYNICSRTSSPRPGDLVFFVGTCDTAGISHVGIYEGDGWMLHCGDPISYANLNSSYWQSHLYAYGRLP